MDARKPDISRASPTNPHRRRFLAASIIGATTALVLGHEAALAFANPETRSAAPAGFLPLSRLLTGKAIDDSLGDRAWQAIVSRQPDFPARFTQLDAALKSVDLSRTPDWPSAPVFADAALKATALAIVSAWYLGVVGEVKDRAEDGPAFITYAGALMWRPTLDVTVIPTYARGKPGYWKEKPASVATD